MNSTTKRGEGVPLCVDLDRTLTTIDTLHEALLTLARDAPFALLSLPAWMLAGRARVRREVARRVELDVSLLPLNTELSDWLTLQRAGGRRIVLTTAADAITAQRIAERLGIFDEIIASDEFNDISGHAKRAALVRRYGEKGFDYVGRSRDGVLSAARRVIVVGSATQTNRAPKSAVVEAAFNGSAHSPRTWIKAIRMHQWIKNMLIFLPAILAHKIIDMQVILESIGAFVAFCLCASSIYLVNDLLDLSADRRHPRKCNRPFAAGSLTARSGLIASTLLLIAAAGTAQFLTAEFAIVLAGYYTLTWAYSFRLKRAAIVDVMTLAGLYTIRIIAGSAATGIPLSFWLLAFSVFMFLSLGFVKRYTELLDTRHSGAMTHGRGYTTGDLPLLMSLGITAGYCTVVVMALYINSGDSQALYRHHKPLWLLCPLLLYWVSRVWLLTTRGHMHDDPVVFALRDRISLTVVALFGLILLFSV